MNKRPDKIAVENVKHPGANTSVNAVKYLAMKAAFLKILPAASRGLTRKEMIKKVRAHLPHGVFPGGATSVWWVKTLQLDLKAKGVVARESCKPLSWHKS